MAKFGFNTAEVDVTARQEYGTLPVGDYTLLALEAEEKETQSGGTYIKVKYEVAKGEHQGRFIWFNFNIHNSSEKAQEIGRRQLVSWATAAGKPDAKDTDALIGKPFKCTVGIEKGTGGYADKNTIKVFLFDTDGEKPAPAPKAPAPAPAKAGGSRQKQPWDD